MRLNGPSWTENHGLLSCVCGLYIVPATVLCLCSLKIIFVLEMLFVKQTALHLLFSVATFHSPGPVSSQNCICSKTALVAIVSFYLINFHITIFLLKYHFTAFPIVFLANPFIVSILFVLSGIYWLTFLDIHHLHSISYIPENCVH